MDLLFGNLSIHALFVPGHTPACMAYEIGDAIFTGDTYSCLMLVPPAVIFQAAVLTPSISRYKKS